MKRSLMMKTMFATMLAIPTFAVAGCASDASETDESNIGVDSSALYDKVTVEADRLIFDKGVYAQLESKGVIAKIDAWMANGRSGEPVFMLDNRASTAVGADGLIDESSRNPVGYVRKVKSYELKDDGTLVVMTDPASVVEAQAELERAGVITRGRRGGAGGIQAQNVSETDADAIWSKEWETDFGFGPSGKVFDLKTLPLKKVTFRRDGFTPVLGETFNLSEPLFHVPGSFGDFKINLKTAKITVAPKFKGKLAVEGLRTNNGFMELSGTAASEIEFEAIATGQINKVAEGSFHIARYAMPDQIGPLSVFKRFPLSMSIEADWKCEFEASGEAQANIGAIAQGGLKARIGFENFGVLPLTVEQAPAYTIKAIGPSFNSAAKVRAHCWIQPVVQTQFFDASGPFAGIQVYADASAEARGTQASGQLDTSLDIGATLRSGGVMKPFGVTLMDDLVAEKTISVPGSPFKKTFTIGQ